VKKKRFSVEQIVAVLKQAEMGMPVADVIRQVGISEQTFYRWKKQYTGMESDQVRELKQLKEENARLKKLLAELSLDKAILQDINAKNGTARAEAQSGGVCRAALRHLAATGLPDREAAPEHAVLSVLQGSQDRATGADEGAGPSPGPVRVSAPACSPAARRLVARQGPDVSALHRGASTTAIQATTASQDARDPARAICAEAGQPGVVNGFCG
jgi:putative transposase